MTYKILEIVKVPIDEDDRTQIHYSQKIEWEDFNDKKIPLEDCRYERMNLEPLSVKEIRKQKHTQSIAPDAYTPKRKNFGSYYSTPWSDVLDMLFPYGVLQERDLTPEKARDILDEHPEFKNFHREGKTREDIIGKYLNWVIDPNARIPTDHDYEWK